MFLSFDDPASLDSLIVSIGWLLSPEGILRWSEIWQNKFLQKHFLD